MASENDKLMAWEIGYEHGIDGVEPEHTFTVAEMRDEYLAGHAEGKKDRHKYAYTGQKK